MAAVFFHPVTMDVSGPPAQTAVPSSSGRIAALAAVLLLLALSLTPGGGGGGGDGPLTTGVHAYAGETSVVPTSATRYADGDEWGPENDTEDLEGASATGYLECGTDLYFMQGNGGGDATLTVHGGLARLLRLRLDDPWYGYGGNRDGRVRQGPLDRQDSEAGAFAETFEDRLEGTSQVFTDLPPPGFDSRFKGMDLRRDQNGGVDVSSLTGLNGTPVGSTDPVVMELRFKGSITGEDRDVLFTDGYVLVYALFGEEFNVTISEELSITTIGFTDLEPQDGGGGFSRERLPWGETVTWSRTYVTGPGRSGESAVTVSYSGFSPVRSPPLIFTYLVLAALVCGLSHRWFKGRSMQRRNIPFIALSVGLFLFLGLQFHMDLDARFISTLILLVGAALTASCRLLYPPSPAIVSGLDIRPMATGNLLGPGMSGGMCTPTLVGDGACGEPRGEVKGWEMLHKSAHEHYSRGNRARALEVIEAGLKLDPTNAYLLNDKGYILLQQNEHEEALECFKAALKSQPDNHVARANITRCLIEKDL